MVPVCLGEKQERAESVTWQAWGVSLLTVRWARQIKLAGVLFSRASFFVIQQRQLLFYLKEPDCALCRRASFLVIQEGKYLFSFLGKIKVQNCLKIALVKKLKNCIGEKRVSAKGRTLQRGGVVNGKVCYRWGYKPIQFSRARLPIFLFHSPPTSYSISVNDPLNQCTACTTELQYASKFCHVFIQNCNLKKTEMTKTCKNYP